jgi:hypothetical protein
MPLSFIVPLVDPLDIELPPDDWFDIPLVCASAMPETPTAKAKARGRILRVMRSSPENAKFTIGC